MPWSDDFQGDRTSEPAGACWNEVLDSSGLHSLSLTVQVVEELQSTPREAG